MGGDVVSNQGKREEPSEWMGVSDRRDAIIAAVRKHVPGTIYNC